MQLERRKKRLVIVRDQRVILSGELAELYQVQHRALIQAVSRNARRFPHDFMFRLTPDEASNLRSQIVISSLGHGGTRYTPLAFTEQGVAMLSSVLRSARAIAVNIDIMRAFVSLRQWLISNRELARQVAAMKKAYDGQFELVFATLEELVARPSPPRKVIGFKK